jgi:Tol biopolymer transport system component
VAAFSWSPDGSKIAYFVPSDSPSGEEGAVTPLILKVLNVRTGTVRTVTTFRPNPYFAGLLQDYGQYAESTRLWSPDGKYLLYCAMQPDSFDVMVAYADQPIAPRKIADGLMATWSPR